MHRNCRADTRLVRRRFVQLGASIVGMTASDGRPIHPATWNLFARHGLGSSFRWFGLSEPTNRSQQDLLVGGLVAQLVDFWSTWRPMPDRGVEPPDSDDLTRDLEVLRRAGIAKLAGLELPALAQLARASGHLRPDQRAAAPVLEEVLRSALAELAGDRLGDCGELLFGLAPGTRGYTPTELRRDAAERWGVSEARFRRAPQEAVLSAVTSTMLRQAHQYQQRLAYLNLERRLPPTSRLAVAWLERFESYYAVWTPLSGLGGDLTAYRSTLLDTDRPYDESYLRIMHERAGGEMANFHALLRSDEIARAIHDEWQEWAARCKCTWTLQDRSDREHYPTHRHHSGIDIKCQLHAVITAANDYCTLIDDDWNRIADWYHQLEPWTNPVVSESLYHDLASGSRGS